MKKIFLLAITIFTLASCTSNSDDVNNEGTIELKPLLKSITNNGDFTGTYTYDGNKIIKYTGSKYNWDVEIFTYTNDLITETKDVYNTKVDQYFYEDNRLTYVIHKMNLGVGTELKNFTKTVYTYPSPLEIEGKVYQYDQNGDLSTSYSERIKYTINNSGNIAKIEKFGEFGSPVKYTESYEYDNKNNCFKNVLGFNKLLDPERRAANNISKKVTQQSGYGQNITTITYLYDHNGYPTSRLINANGNSSSFTLIY